MLELARPWEVNEEKETEILDLLSKRCEACQRTSNAPDCFRPSLPTENDFISGKERSVDLIFLEEKAVLNKEDTATHSSAAAFLNSASENYDPFLEGI